MPADFELVEVPLSDRKLVERFIRVPWYVNREHHPNPRWVPPLLMDRRDYLNPKKNPFFKHVDAKFWIAVKNGKDVGRVAAVKDEDYIRFWDEPSGYLGMFECENDPAVAQALVDRAAKFLAAKGCTEMVGPYELSSNYISGLLVEGFDRDPCINMPHNPPYYDELLKGCGMEKAKDLYQWGLDARKPLPERMVKMARRVEQRGVKIRPMSKKDWNAEVKRALAIYNDAWEKNWGFVPMSDEEFLHVAQDLKLVIKDDFAVIAEHEGKPVAFSIAILNLNPTFKRLNGRLRVGRLIWDVFIAQNFTGARLILMGIKNGYRGLGIDAAMVVATHEAAQKHKLYDGELGWTLEDNVRINRLIESVGGEIVSRYRIYRRELGTQEKAS